MGAVSVGTSGWSYQHWDGEFYPKGLPKSRWFDHYSTWFPTVEINYSFYRLPSPSTIERWREQARKQFRYAVKGSRLITHYRRLSNCSDQLSTYLERTSGLGHTLGPILWQLPPDLERDLELLDGFLSMLPGGLRHAVEFRHPSWLVDEAFDLLHKRGAAAVSVSSLRMPRDFTVTADFVYARLHGLEGAYQHDYSAAELEPWVQFLSAAAGRGEQAFAYFNNDGKAKAPKNALELIDMLGEAAVQW